MGQGFLGESNAGDGVMRVGFMPLVSMIMGTVGKTSRLKGATNIIYIRACIEAWSPAGNDLGTLINLFSAGILGESWSLRHHHVTQG